MLCSCLNGVNAVTALQPLQEVVPPHILGGAADGKLLQCASTSIES